MSIVNYWNGKNSDGSLLFDLVGTNDGTLAGSVLPSVNSNGYLEFTAGNNSRVDFVLTSEMQKTSSSEFSLLLIWRKGIPVITETQIIFMPGRDWKKMWGFLIQGPDFPDWTDKLFADYRDNWGASDVQQKATEAITDDKWHYDVMTKSTSATDLDGFHDMENNNWEYRTNGTPSGNLYYGDSRVAMGSGYRGGWGNDFEGSIDTLIHFDHKLSVAEASNYISYHKGVL